MSRPRFRAPVALLTALSVLWVPVALDALALPQPATCQTPDAIQVDNRDGYFVHSEEGPVYPLALTADRRELWAVNIPDASVSVLSTVNPTSLTLKGIVKVGLGPVSVVPRPVASPEEIWVVCQSSNSVVIIDRAKRRVLDSIRLLHEPAGLVFDATGSKAWVSLATANKVVEINAATRAVTATLDFSTPFPTTGSPLVHAEEPRALLLDGSDLYVASFESGNGTLGLTGGILDETIVQLWNFYTPSGTIPPPPDRDVLRFSVPGANPASVALWRAGSINFDLKKDNAGQLWVSNVDYNNTLVGEFQFPSNPVARHRVTHALPMAAPGFPAPGMAPASIDLNASALSSLTGQGYACSMPNQMTFSANFQTLYIACYESHNVAVLDLSSPTPQVVAELRGLTTLPSGAHQNFGVRGLALHSTAGVLYSYSRDNRVQVYQVPVASGTVNAPVQTVNLGFDITPSLVKEGRFININALRSANKAQSCNTCHVDGHLDRIAWNLSDFTGDLPAHPIPRVAKGTKVTMSLRGIEETPPFHWRGDRDDLASFNPAFQGLLGGTQLTPAEMEAYLAFIFSLSYPANPNELEDRSLTLAAANGAHAFRCKEAHALSFDTHPTAPQIQNVSCQFCHGMSGASGTNNQVNNDIVGLLADDATQLRGLFDKASDTVDYNTAFGLTAPLDKVPATGWGFGNTGSFADTVTDFVNLVVFQLLSQADRNDIVTFLDEFDTGTAPAAAYAWTLNQASSGSPNQPFNTLLQAQANAGHIDLVARGWMMVSGVTRSIGMQYNPQTALFDTDTTGVGPFSYAQLVTTAANSRGVLLLVGTPRGMGYRLGRDMEMDFALDGNEAAAGAVVGLADTDGDGFPDGYEMRLGSSPANPLSLPPPDITAPGFTTAPQVAWKNSSIVKVRWKTGEESTSRIEVQPAGTVGTPLVVKEDLQPKKEHVLVVRGLQPGQSFDLHVKSTDPASPGNTATQVIANVAMQPFDFQSVHLTQTTLTAAPGACGSQVQLTATFLVVDEGGNPVPGATVTFSEVEWIPGAGNHPNSPRTGLTTGPSNTLGIATATFTSDHAACNGAQAEVFATTVTEPITNRLYFHPLDGQLGFWKQAALP